MRFRHLLLLALLTTGCAAKKAFKNGFRAEEAGREWEAAGYYLDALDRKPTHEDATLGIDRVAQEALAEGLGYARSEEQGEDFLAAMRWYQLLVRYTERLERHNQLDFAVGIDLEDKIEEMRAAAAYEAYAAGDEAISRRAWAQAIEQVQAAQGIVPDFKDSSLRIAEAHYGWAVDDVAATRYRSAAQRFQQAVSSDGPFEDSAVRAVELYAALGRHHLAAGACRQAVRDLRIAHQSYPAEVGADLTSAETCAHKGVLVEPISGGGRVSGVVVSDWLEGYIQREFASQSSEFVDLVADTGNKHGVDYAVTVRVSEAWLNGPQVQRVQRSSTAQRARVCQEMETAPCLQTVPLTYTEISSAMESRVAANVQVVDMDTGRFIGQAQPTGDAASRLSWADGFTAGGEATGIGSEPSAGVVAVESTILSLRDASRVHPSEADLLADALEKVGRDAMVTILAAVDADPAVTDPRSLTVVPLVEK